MDRLQIADEAQAHARLYLHLTLMHMNSQSLRALTKIQGEKTILNSYHNNYRNQFYFILFYLFKRAHRPKR